MMNVQHFYRPGEELCKEPLHYLDCGLDNIYLKNGFSIEEGEDGDKYLTVTDMDGLHRAIGLHIVLERKAPSGKELRFLRNEMDMSQADIAKMLGVSDQSVARWEKGHHEANGAAVFGLRIIYVMSLIPEKEKHELMKGLLERLSKLSEKDEIKDDVILSYRGNRWYDSELRAA